MRVTWRWRHKKNTFMRYYEIEEIMKKIVPERRGNAIPGQFSFSEPVYFSGSFCDMKSSNQAVVIMSAV